MKPLAFITAVALATVTFIGAQQIRAASVSADTAAAKKEILRLEEQRNQAILSGDAGALERMTSDDYTFITLRGELRTKSEIVEGFKSGSFHYDSRQIME